MDLAFDHRDVLVDGDFRGLTEVRDLYVLQPEAFGDRLPAGQDGNGLQHGLAAETPFAS